MLVKKKNPEWFPSENKNLKVGETIDITDPRSLIIGGDVIGLAEDGITELSAYELYGVLVADERQEFEEYLKIKKAQSTQVALQKEKEVLEEQLKKVSPEPASVETQVTQPVAKKK
jgi:hypothetical protein